MNIPSLRANNVSAAIQFMERAGLLRHLRLLAMTIGLCLLMPLPAPATECVTSGCSGELCVEAGNDMASTCEFRPEFACYKQHGTCERQKDGSCGWTETEALKQCIADIKDQPTIPMAPQAQ